MESPQRTWTRIWRQRWEPVDRAVAAYTVAVFVLVALRAEFVPHAYWLLAIHAGILAALAALPPRGAAWELPRPGESTTRRRLRETVRFVRYSYPLPLAWFFFEEIAYTVNCLWPDSPYWFEPWLYRWDRALFGELPVLTMDAWVSPLLTEVMHVFYFSYFPIMIAALVVAWNVGPTPSRSSLPPTPGPAHRITVTSLAFSFLLVFVPYPWLPARGPWESPEVMAGLQPLDGYVFTWIMDLIIDNYAVSGACFPSAHVAGAWGAVLGLWMGLEGRDRRWAYGLGGLATGMSFACVYTRYHHAVDIVAGIPIAVVGAALALAAVGMSGRGQRRVTEAGIHGPDAGDQEGDHERAREPERAGRGRTARTVSAGLALLVAVTPATSATPTTDNDPADFYELGQAHLFSLDYQQALEAFDRALERYPDHPGPYAWKATALWMREMFRRGEFDLEGYLDVTRFKEGDEPEDGTESEARGDIGPGNEPRAEITAEVESLVASGLEVANSWVTDRERRAEGRYYRGILRGISASYRALVLRKFFSAVGDMKNAVAEHRALVERHPEWIDPLFTVGTYNYVAGSLPWYVKILAVFVGVHGDAEEGLRQLQRVAEQGDRLRDSAKLSLAVIHAREGRPQRSAALLGDLARRFPRNHLFPYNRAVALGLAGRWEAAADLQGRMVERMRAGEPNYDKAKPHRLLLEWGYAALRAGRPAEALDAYRSVADSRADQAPGWAVTVALLGQGRAHDLAGERAAALGAYRRVLERPEIGEVHEQARDHLEEPFSLGFFESDDRRETGPAAMLPLRQTGGRDRPVETRSVPAADRQRLAVQSVHPFP